MKRYALYAKVEVHPWDIGFAEDLCAKYKRSATDWSRENCEERWQAVGMNIARQLAYPVVVWKYHLLDSTSVDKRLPEPTTMRFGVQDGVASVIGPEVVDMRPCRFETGFLVELTD